MVALCGATGATLTAPSSRCDVVPGRLGASLGAQGQLCWRCSRAAPRRRRRQQQQQQQGRRVQPARAALLDPPPFDPAKLRVEYLPGGRDSQLAGGRRYTLTHNDVTGSLQLSIGREYNRRQLDGWYTRMLRDEVLAEWQDTAAPVAAGAEPGAAPRPPPQPSLHIYCHVSGEELWPAPPQLRSFIFQREMALVLDTIAHAEAAAGGLLAAAPHLRAAPVYVHLRSDIPALDRVVEWGTLGDRTSWRTAQSSIMRSLLSSVMGTMDEGDAAATDGSGGSWSRGAFSASSSWDGGAGGGGMGGGGMGGGAAAWDAATSWEAAEAAGASGDCLQPPAGAPAAEDVPAAQAQAQAQACCSDCSSSSSSSSLGQQQPAAAGGLGTGPSSNGTSPRVAAAAGGTGLGAANGVVSLAAPQQAAAADGPTWLGATAAVADGRRRLPAAEVVPAAISRRHR